jgi:hypothetical protein
MKSFQSRATWVKPYPSEGHELRARVPRPNPPKNKPINMERTISCDTLQEISPQSPKTKKKLKKNKAREFPFANNCHAKWKITGKVAVTHTRKKICR